MRARLSTQMRYLHNHRQFKRFFASQSTTAPYPRTIQDLDSFAEKTLDAGAELESDHPGFNDTTYRQRRASIVNAAKLHRHGEQVARINYNNKEVATWGAVYRKLISMYGKYACDQFNETIPIMERNCGYGPDSIPQQQDISDFLKSRTGFTLRPVMGLLSSRDFLNALAHRVFFSTQYIRHHSRPLYTPEPDVCHELLGHVPMFADPDFADFSHQIGLASLGATDDAIQRLATCYWHTVEFGLVRQRGSLRAYGAGLLSSFGELEYSCAPFRPAGGTDQTPQYIAFDPEIASTTPYPITTYQPTYFVCDSIAEVKSSMVEYCESLKASPHSGDTDS